MSTGKKPTRQPDPKLVEVDELIYDLRCQVQDYRNILLQFRDAIDKALKENP